MPKIIIKVGDVKDELSIAFAKAHGYQFKLISDGNAEITNGVGHVCRVHNFECNCPDKRANGRSHNGRCSHEIWVAQLLPCDVCGGMMGFGIFQSCFGSRMERFECPNCLNVRDFELVRVERKMRRRAAKKESLQHV